MCCISRTYVLGEVGIGVGQILIHSLTHYVKNLYFFSGCNETPSKIFKQGSNMILFVWWYGLW